MKSGTFRSDLYHRLNQCQIRVPPLRDRKDDIFPLAMHFLRQQSRDAVFSDEARQALRSHHWPGNARELRNVVIRALVNGQGDVIDAEDLGCLETPKSMVRRPVGELELAGLEKEAILEALRKTGGHHQQAAGLLGISRRTLSRKLRMYGADAREEASYA